MAAKKTAKTTKKSTKRSAPKAAPKPEEQLEIADTKVEELEEDPKVIRKFVVQYITNMQDREFIEHGHTIVKDSEGKKETEVVIPEFRIKAGETKVLDEDSFYYLFDKGMILDEDALRLKTQKREDLLKVKSGREEPKQEMQIISDEDKRQIFIHIPRLIQVIEEPVEEEIKEE